MTGEGKPTAHAELWDVLLELCEVHEVEFVWLPVEGIEEYAQCHRLARQVIQEQVGAWPRGRRTERLGRTAGRLRFVRASASPITRAGCGARRSAITSERVADCEGER